MAIEFDRQTCRWCPLGDAAEMRRSDERKAILEVLAKEEGPLSPGEIAELLGRSPGVDRGKE
jgi:Fe2+ or Zn2+ uptake regulation protein